jgi:hypothetical protein
VGDKSPKSKQRNQKQKDAKAKDKAKKETVAATPSLTKKK